MNVASGADDDASGGLAADDSSDSDDFDHVAFAAPRRALGYGVFVTKLGGRWVLGGTGPTGEFESAQIAFADGPKVEILEPGPATNGFVARFLDHRGAGPHHLTFKVTDVARFIDACAEHGFVTLPGHDDPTARHREVFVHPKATGFGTLLQAISFAGPIDPMVPPAGFPESGAEHVLEWVALGVPDPRSASDFFVDASGAAVIADTSTSRLLRWQSGHHLALLAGRPGVHHLLFRRLGAGCPTVSDAVSATEGAERVFGVPIVVAG